MTKFTCPTARPAVASPDLTRPDWTKAEARDPSVLWLDKNENTDPELARLVAGVVADLPTDMQFTYPDTGPAYTKLAAWLGGGLGPENLLFGAGSDGLIRAVFEAFVSPGDTVLHTAPTFAMYFVYSKIFGAREVTVPYEASETGPRLGVDTLVAAIHENAPRVVCLPNPDSPTGSVFDPDQMRAIIEAAGEVGAVMLIDEAYHPFHRETCLPWVLEYPHLFVTRSTGKAWGLAGFRIGYGAASADLARTLHKVKGMYEIGAFSLALFARMLDHADAMEASVRRLEAGKEHFLRAMDDLGLHRLDGAGNFLHVAFGPHAEKVHAALAGLVYYRRDFHEPCLRGFSRFSATTPERFSPVIDRIRQAVT